MSYRTRRVQDATGRVAVWLVAAALLAGLTLPAYGQLSSGSILGTITDATGAVIPGVSVKITNPAIGLSRDVISNESGNYRVDQLPIGNYTIEVELTGFKKEVRNNVNVAIDQRARLDFVLQPGNVSEVVEVSAEAPLVQSEDSSIGQVVEERKIVALPLNGRDFSQLAYMVPGAFTPRPGSSLGDRGGFSVAGLNENTNQFLLDGVNNNGTGTMEIAARINVDAVGEFKVQTGTYAAQYGRYAGAQVDVVTKSGTNDFHGSAFGFTRNDNLDARNFFDRTKPEFPAASIRRHSRRTDSARQVVLLRRFSGTAAVPVPIDGAQRTASRDVQRRPFRDAAGGDRSAHQPAFPEQSDPREPHQLDNPGDGPILAQSGAARNLSERQRTAADTG
jgi:hypothetical protein